METFLNQKVINVNAIVDDYYLDNKILFMHCFNCLPNVSANYNLQGEKAYKQFVIKFKDLIDQTHSSTAFRRKEQKYDLGRTIVILKNECLLEFTWDYCEIIHDGKQPELIDQITSLVNQFKQKQRRLPLEINLVVQGHSGLELKAMEVKRNKLELDLFYDDAFIKTDELIRKRLNKKNDKGIVLLHGIPGTGKTSYLRYLIGKIKKRILFLSPSVAGDLMSPGFIELLINNANSVLIIEDAENIIMDRKQNSGSAVSNLLNISDGLLADFLNVQLICTFNSSLTLIDSALMRKGRLIAKHEFGKLNQLKAQRLSNHFGFNTVINRPMTIAEISNQHEEEFAPVKRETVGFRTQLMEN